MHIRWRKIFLGLAGALLLLLLGFSYFVWNLNEELTTRLAQRQIASPTEYWTAPQTFSRGAPWSQQKTADFLNQLGYREIESSQNLSPGLYQRGTEAECLAKLGQQEMTFTSCLIFSLRESSDPDLQEPERRVQAFAWSEKTDEIGAVFFNNPLVVTDFVLLDSRVFAQTIGSTPVLQKWKDLGETPPQCLNAVLAIEDAHFLTHSGVSFLGILRASIVNLIQGRVAQGGSTITQQMVKNYFLTPDRTLKRKFLEIALSLLLESHQNKDEILQTYLNIIYMGQSGPFEVRGFAAAAQHYFEKDLSDLELPECALLAAILNSPGSFDPFRKPDNAIKRRARVLDRMVELEKISALQAEEAKKFPLPQATKKPIWETAPYYLQVVNRQIEQTGYSIDGLKIYTGLNLEQQSKAQNSLQNRLKKLETDFPKIRKYAEQKIPLESSLVSMSLQSQWVSAAVGGRSFRQTQFNRLLDGRRQIGSLIKPFVYLTAFQQKPELTPLSLIDDSPLEYKFEGQVWRPENYDELFHGQIPTYFALKNSFNVATARLGIEVGLEQVSETLKTASGRWELGTARPSLTLGAVELTPLEVLQAYSTLAQFGLKKKPIWIRGFRNPAGDLVFKSSSEAEQIFDARRAAQVVSMLKQATKTGTAASLASRKWNLNIAGKTGTTSDFKDAWFAGFTPQQLTVAWVGYDQSLSSGLTGASGPVPVWGDFMEALQLNVSGEDFHWPAKTRLETFQPENEKTPIELLMLEN